MHIYYSAKTREVKAGLNHDTFLKIGKTFSIRSKWQTFTDASQTLLRFLDTEEMTNYNVQAFTGQLITFKNKIESIDFDCRMNIRHEYEFQYQQSHPGFRL